MSVQLKVIAILGASGLIVWLFAMAAAMTVVMTAVLTLSAANLAAEPYMSVREGYKCSKCHVNHTGGGKRTDYAQVYMQTRMAAGGAAPASPEDRAADDFFTGRLSEFFSVGADLRTIYTKVSPFQGEDSQHFNRPSGCAACHQATGGGGKLAEIYFQLEVAPGKASIVASQNLQPTTQSREVYGLVENLPLAGYFKAGTFRLPTGLQNTFDDPFAHGTGRLNFGFDGVVGVESVRGTGLEVGIEPGPFAVAFSVTNPVDTSAVPRDNRLVLTAYAVGSLGMFGFNFADDPLSGTVTRETASVFAGVSLGRFTGLLHLDRTATKDEADSSKARRRTGLGEVNFLLSKGANLKAVYEFMDPEQETGDDLVDRFSIIFEPFLTPYLQLRAGYRDYTGPAGDETSNFDIYFVESHFLF